MVDIYSTPPVYDPDTLKTFEEYKAIAALMGCIFDWRDGSFCQLNGEDAACWSFDEDDAPKVEPPPPNEDNMFGAFCLDCVTGEAIWGLTAHERRLYYDTNEARLLVDHIDFTKEVFAPTFKGKKLPWLRYPER